MRYREDDPLGGHDPYSASKAARELVIGSYRAVRSWRRSASRLRPRARAMSSAAATGPRTGSFPTPCAPAGGRPLRVRARTRCGPGSTSSSRSSGYLALAQRLWERPALAGAYNFGPELGEAVKVRDLVELACAAYGNGAVDYGDGSEGPHKSGWLVLDAGKTESVLGFSQRWTLIEGVKRTMAWYRALCNAVRMHARFAWPTCRISRAVPRAPRRSGRGLPDSALQNGVLNSANATSPASRSETTGFALGHDTPANPSGCRVVGRRINRADVIEQSCASGPDVKAVRATRGNEDAVAARAIQFETFMLPVHARAPAQVDDDIERFACDASHQLVVVVRRGCWK